ncbi:COX15/CtaA family protein [Bacillus sp. mrc49]|uniref:COX15/CtaA family protein n=1 Tax=Bacillus sp. mrc49 TaxID=2054913 RepID=UPI000C271787|nr:heme A synthase [Bacillus sp. mrc49]PJN87021.1 heme A synthase [Bacillus sp. mrc49]
MKSSLKWFAVLTTIVMLFILLGGALVTKTDSGMGCGRSWPLCNGQLIPDKITLELVIELSHRLVSGAGGFLVLLLSYMSWREIGHIREARFLSVLSFSFLLLQGLIGAAAVLWSQSDFVLALHFGISLISFASVFLLTLLIFEVDKKFEAEKLIVDKRMKFHITGVLVFSLFVVYTGALVRHTESSLICKDWPLCINDSPALPSNLYEWVQMGHRAIAGTIFLWVSYVTYIAHKYYKNQKVIYGGWIAAFILVFLQVTAGAFIIFSRQNLYIALSHALFIACFFGVMSYLMLLTSRSKKNALAKLKGSSPNTVNVHNEHDITPTLPAR